MINLCHPTQNNKSVEVPHTFAVRKYSTQGRVSWQIQHSAMPHAVFVTQPLPVLYALAAMLKLV